LKIFISWSGEKSREIANATSDWVKFIFPSVKTWISTRDINAGDRSMSEIEDGLKDAEFGIICVTPENQNANWINFEAGAISRSVGGVAKVAPIIDGFRSKADLKGPLAQFQTSLADQEGFTALAKGINKHLDEEHGRNEEALKKALKLYWPELEATLEKIRARFTTPGIIASPVERSQEDMLEEVLVSVRDMARRLDELPPSLSARNYAHHVPVRTLSGEIIPSYSKPSAGDLTDFLVDVIGVSAIGGAGVNEFKDQLEASVLLKRLPKTGEVVRLKSEIMHAFPAITKVVVSLQKADGSHQLLS